MNFFPAPGSSWVFVAISMALMTIYFVVFTSITFSHLMNGKIKAIISKHVVQRNTTYIGLAGLFLGKSIHETLRFTCWTCCTGMVLVAVLRIYYGKAVDDFNATFVPVDASTPFGASIGNGFYSESWRVDPWIPLFNCLFSVFVLAYIFFALSIFCSITKINVKASTGKWSVWILFTNYTLMYF